MNKLVEINSLTVRYDNKPNVLNDVSLTIYEDDFLGVIGPNGGGKTTLLKTILGLIRPESGTINFYDKGIKVPSINVGYLPQINQIDKKFPISVRYDNKPNVLNDVSLTIYEDDFLGVIGPNGGGKTTLLKTILGLIRPESGTINFYDKGIKVPSINVGYLPQINQIDKKFPISVSEVILSGI